MPKAANSPGGRAVAAATPPPEQTAGVWEETATPGETPPFGSLEEEQAAPVKPAPKPRASRARKPVEPVEADDEPAVTATIPGDGDWFFQTSEEDEKLKVLYYGREGTTKTTSAATATQFGRTLFILAEGGVKPGALVKHGVVKENLRVWPDPRRGEVITKDSLEALHAKILAALQADPDAFFAVVIDSWTELAAQFVGLATDKRVQKHQAAGKEIDPDFVDRDDYGVMTKQLRALLRRFRDLPCHVIFTALEKVDDDTKETVPAISPAIRVDTLGAMDMTLYVRRAPAQAGLDPEDAPELYIRALTAGSNPRAKDRFDVLPRAMALPTFARILAYKQGTLDEETDPVQVAYREVRGVEEAAAAEKERKLAEAKAARVAGRK